MKCILLTRMLQPTKNGFVPMMLQVTTNLYLSPLVADSFSVRKPISYRVKTGFEAHCHSVHHSREEELKD